MPLASQRETEQLVRSSIAAGDLQRAATLALGGLGPEILRFLRARLHDRSQAEEAYLQFSEDLWVGLPSFRWESSLRVWMFVLARNAATRVGRRQRREVPLPTEVGESRGLAPQVRTATAQFIRTAIKDRMREIRLRLPEEDQTLLILRVDRGLEWRELAVVMNEVSAEAPSEEHERASARLRTRFQAAKKRLRELAEAEGLVRRETEAT